MRGIMELSSHLEINLGKIQENAARIVEKCAQQGIEVLGVTKGFSAQPRIVRAMVRGGVKNWPTPGWKISWHYESSTFPKASRF